MPLKSQILDIIWLGYCSIFTLQHRFALEVNSVILLSHSLVLVLVLIQLFTGWNSISYNWCLHWSILTLNYVTTTILAFPNSSHMIPTITIQSLMASLHFLELDIFSSQDNILVTYLLSLASSGHHNCSWTSSSHLMLKARFLSVEKK